MLSKKRYWGLALPIWVCDNKACNHHEVIGSEDELRERAVEGWDVFEGHTPHRPYVDAVKIACPKCGSTMTRIEDVGNPWLDAGSVAYSTLRYRTDREYWNTWFPAHWISESFPGQFRNWFYSLITMSTVFENRPRPGSSTATRRSSPKMVARCTSRGAMPSGSTMQPRPWASTRCAGCLRIRSSTRICSSVTIAPMRPGVALSFPLECLRFLRHLCRHRWLDAAQEPAHQPGSS